MSLNEIAGMGKRWVGRTFGRPSRPVSPPAPSAPAPSPLTAPAPAADAPSGAWLVEPVGGMPPGVLGDVWFAPPFEASGTLLVFTGYVPKGTKTTCMRVYQSEVLQGEANSAPGFSLSVPLQQGMYRIELWHEEQCLGHWDAIPQERETAARTELGKPFAPAPHTIDTTRPYALHGRMSHLFLAGDSNDSLSQFTQTKSLSAGSAQAWEQTFAQFDGWQRTFGINRISTLIAPAKEEILREYYPFARAPRTLLDDYVTRFKDKPVIFPKWELWNRRQYAYCNTDTHWTDYGATVAAGTVLKAWGLPETGLPDAFNVLRRFGDLGLKTEPVSSGFELIFPPGTRPQPVFDNGVTNQGCIRIWHTPDAPDPGSLMIFGDSFGPNLAEALATVFRDVIYAYQPAGFDPELVTILRPENVLLQITQRFIHGQPETGVPVLQKARDKVSAMPDDKRTALREKLSATEAKFRPLVAPLLE